MLYIYEDSFLIKKVDDVELQSLEDKAIQEADKLGITDELYKEQLVKAKVYTQIAIRHIEADGMKEKYEAYKVQLDETYKKAKTNSPSNISSMSIARG
ncbi:hypothetical protein [Nitratiruptor sp. SB155-2]|uniref:hypothetical protein n=1 Tax=Nitratiruptor sp. (strain SB155-2) TaxID=387092 RepID=UPI0003078D0C|nr:hypothetical protein [Nitratiruptor sp. SB155-2]